MSRLVCIGDIHLRQDALQPKRLRSWDRIIEHGSALADLGAWVMTGDLFDTRSSIADRNDAATRLQRMARLAPVLLPYGNHDLDGDLDIFARLEAEWPISVFARPECRRIRLATGAFATVFALPYPHKAGLAAAGVAACDTLDAADQALDAIFMRAAAELADAATRDATFMVGHGNIVGAVASNGQPQIGREISVTESHLQRLGAICKIFGHIHKPQDIGGAFFVGSGARLDWGELEEKRFVVVDLRPDSSWTAESVPLFSEPHYLVNGTLTRDGFTWGLAHGADRVVPDPPASWEHCEVRVRYHYKQSEKPVLDESLVKAPFAAALRLVVEPIAEPDRALRAPEVAVARSLADKVTAYGHIAGISVTDRLLEKLGRLETTDPEALVAAVADEAAAVAREGREVAA